MKMNIKVTSGFFFTGFFRIAFNNLIILILILVLPACASNKPYQINMMPAPDVFSGGIFDPFPDSDPDTWVPYGGILYATDREPVTDETRTDRIQFYQNQRSFLLRLGVGEITVKKEGITWDEIRHASLLKGRSEDYPLAVTGVKELGILVDSYNALTDPELIESNAGQGDIQFAKAVNDKLAISKYKDICIYVHGYKVIFDNPLLVAAELWHFVGYEGVFIAYAWPSTPKTLAYISDLETTELSAQNLRKLLEYLAKETDAERINIIGYSAGTHLILRALHQLSLLHADKNREAVQKELRIGNVILTGSDFDRQLFAMFLDDGLLKVAESFSIYMSETDKALGLSRWVFGRERLGHMWQEENWSPMAIEYLQDHRELSFINATNAEAAATGNGHAYFRKSPWVSSDVLMTLAYSQDPGERGLALSPESQTWVFPPDYGQRLRNILLEKDREVEQ
jgi:esterase/lipase superfamily enzyme